MSPLMAPARAQDQATQYAATIKTTFVAVTNSPAALKAIGPASASVKVRIRLPMAVSQRWISSGLSDGKFVTATKVVLMVAAYWVAWACALAGAISGLIGV